MKLEGYQPNSLPRKLPEKFPSDNGYLKDMSSKYYQHFVRNGILDFFQDFRIESKELQKHQLKENISELSSISDEFKTPNSDKSIKNFHNNSLSTDESTLKKQIDMDQDKKLVFRDISFCNVMKNFKVIISY